LSRSDIGAIFVNKHTNDGYNNSTFGVDANLTFFQYLDVSSYLAKTDTSGVSGEDKAGDLSVEWNDRFLNLRAEHLSIQENFNPEVGFVPRTGIRKSTGEMTVRPRPGEAIPWIREFRPSASVHYITDQENTLESRRADQNISVGFEDSSNVWFTRRSHFERLDEPFEIRDGQFIPVGDYHYVEYLGSASSNRSRMFSGGIMLSRGGFFDGTKNSYQLDFAFRPSYHFAAEVDWRRENLDIPSGDFKTNLVTTRMNYSFTPKIFLDALVQYNSTVEEISSNIRFNFIYQPLSDLFVVYNERRSTTGEVLDRAVILKLTYIFGF
jgi:hypothetical protein